MDHKNLSLVCFDFDGLILDSETVVFEVWSEIYKDYGASLDPQAWLQCVGADHGLFDPVRDIQIQTGQSVDGAKLRILKERSKHERVWDLPAKEGVAELLKELKKEGVSRALVSSSHYAWVFSHLRRLGLDVLFDEIVTRDFVQKAKPHPDLYILAARICGVPSKQAVALEDSLNGCRSAKAAGMKCVLIPSELTSLGLLEGEDLRVPSCAALSVARLVSLV